MTNEYYYRAGVCVWFVSRKVIFARLASMIFAMARKWVLVLLGTVLAAVRTGGMSGGAPADACDTFTPMHYGNSAQSGDGGFKLYSDLIDNGGSYEAGQEYNSELRSYTISFVCVHRSRMYMTSSSIPLSQLL